MFFKSLQKGSIRAAGVLLAVCVIFGAYAKDIYAGAVNSPDPESGESGGTLQSSNAHLKSLSVTPGTLSPEFSPEVTNYTINVSEDVDTVSVACSVEETTSKVIEAGGFKRLQQGSNSAHVTVQAEDGSKLTYNFTINRGAASGNAGDGETELQSDTGTVQDGESGSGSEDGTDGNGAAAVSAGADGAVTTSAGADAVGDMTSGAQTPAAIDPVTNRIPIGGESIYSSFQIDLTYPQELLPEGFVQETYNYKGIDVQSAYFAAGNIRLLYLTTGDGTSSDFRIYYEDSDSFLDFLQLKGIDGKFIMPVRYEAQIKIPDNYTGTYLPWENKVIPAYIYTELTDKPVTVPGEEGNEDSGEQEGQDEEPVKVEELDKEVEFYLLYAVNNEGSENFYLYDIVEGTYQRYVERDTSYELDQSYFKYKDVAHKRFAIMCVMACLLLIAVFCIINLIMKNRELKADMGEDDEDDEDDEDESQEDIRRKSRKARDDRRAEKEGAPIAGTGKKAEKKSDTKAADGTEKKPIAEATGRAEKKPAAEAAGRADRKPEAEAVKRTERKSGPETAKRADKKPEAEAVKRAEKKPEEVKRTERKAEQAKKAAGKTVTEAATDMEIDASSLEEKIISQLQLDGEIPSKPSERPKETKAEPERARTARKPSSFKMINLSREPESGGLDDDFEFEFINLDDD